jgi:hypothetical protein
MEIFLKEWYGACAASARSPLAAVQKRPAAGSGAFAVASAIKPSITGPFFAAPDTALLNSQTSEA